MSSRVQPTPPVKSPDAMRQFPMFIVVGLLAWAVDIGLFWVLLEAGVPRIAAAVASFLLASGFNYVLSVSWVFGPGRRSPRLSFALFFLTVGVGVSINVAVMEAFVWLTGGHPAIGKICAGFAVLIWNFWSRRTIVFPAAKAPAALSDTLPER